MRAGGAPDGDGGRWGGCGGVGSSLSRRERIALLEQGVSGVDEAASRRDSEPRRGRAGEPTESSRSPGPDDRLDDDAWLEQRRQNRKLRLQQRGAGRASSLGAAARDGSSAGVDRDGPALGADRGLSVGGAVSSTHTLRHAAASGAQGGGRSSQDELDELARGISGSPEWVAAVNALAGGAHRLPSSGLVRAMELFAVGLASWMAGDGAAVPPAAGAGAAELASQLRPASEALLGCLTAQLGTLGVSVVADAMRVMAATRVEEQTLLDMLLARLLVLLRHERAAFSAAALADIAGALGALHEAGAVSPKRAASGASSASNKRCIDALSERIADSLAMFTDEDIARLGGHFITGFLDDVQKRAVLRHAAELNAGLEKGASQRVSAALQRIEHVVRKHSFAFIASLPDHTKDYLMKLKIASDEARRAATTQTPML